MPSRTSHTPSVPVLLAYNHYGFNDEVHAFWSRKWADILRQPSQVWVETSHLLLKAGLIEALELLDPTHEIHLVALTRDRKSLVRSYLERGDFQRYGERQMWYLDPTAPRHLVPVPPSLATTSLGLSAWYTLEIEARTELARRQVARQPNIHYHALQTRELSGSPALLSLLSALRPSITTENVRLPPPLNRGRGTEYDAETEKAIDATLSSIAGFDAKSYVQQLLQRRPQPFRAYRIPKPVGHSPQSAAAFLIPIDPPTGALLRTVLRRDLGLVTTDDTGFLSPLLREAGKPNVPAKTTHLVQQSILAWARAPRPTEGSLSPHGVLAAAAKLASSVQHNALDSQLPTFLAQCFATATPAPSLVCDPALWEVLPELLQIFPHSPVIFTVRDPRDVLASRKHTAQETQSYIEDWKAKVGRALQAFELSKQRVLVVRYEDLHVSPQATLQQLAELLGLQVEGRPTPIDESEIGVWRDHMTSSQLSVLERGLDNWLDLFGYGPTF